MKRTILTKILIAGAAAGSLFSCKNPTEGVNLNISPQVITHVVQLKVKDANGMNALPPNATLTIGGDDADFVYEISGKKNFTLHDGSITLGLDPALVPSEADPVSFTVQVSAPGYMAQEMDVEVYPEQMTQQVNVSMLNLTAPPPGVELKVQGYKLNNGAITGDYTIKAKPTADSTFYDDGLTTVVLPKGTQFYYYKKAGTYRGVKMPLKMQPDTTYVNGQMVIGSVSSPYQDTIEYPAKGYVKELVTGNDSLVVVCWYAPGEDVDFKFYEKNEVNNAPLIKVLNGEQIKLDELLYKSAVKKRLYSVQFMAYVKENGKRVGVQVNPEKKSGWFTSYVLNPATINPVTNQPIKENDTIEIGVNPNNGKTLRTVVKQASNGQLRAQAQSVEVGYYYKASYTYEFSYVFSGTAPSRDVIPDPENLYGAANIDLGVTNLTYWFWGGGGKYNVTKKIASKSPIKQNDASVYLGYCYKSVPARKVQQGTVVVYDPAAFTTLPPILEVRCRFYCENKKAYVHPSAYFEAEADNRYFYCNFVKGKWRTRGLKEGDVIDAKGWFGDQYFEYPNQTLTNPMLLEKILDGKTESICF